MDDLDERKVLARNWFESLRDQICAALEQIDHGCRFNRKSWERPDGGGGVMSMLHGKVFEKAGVHTSTVHGEFSPRIPQADPGCRRPIRASGPRAFRSSSIRGTRIVPAVHMNTRFIVTTKTWFGGGADLTPVLDRRRTQDYADTLDFHAAMKAACDAHAVADYDAVQDMVRRVFLPAPPQRAARHRRHLL